MSTEVIDKVKKDGYAIINSFYDSQKVSEIRIDCEKYLKSKPAKYNWGRASRITNPNHDLLRYFNQDIFYKCQSEFH